MIRVQANIPLPGFGRKDNPPKKGWFNKYKEFPIEKLKVGYSFNTGINYEYGKTISIKNTCNNRANKLGLKMRFSVRKHNKTIRVWRVA